MTRAPEMATLEAAPTTFDAATAIRTAGSEAARLALPLDITSPPSNAIALAAVERVETDARAVRLVTPVAGLVGPLGPLPPAYTSLAARDRRQGEGAMAAFLDAISARLALLYADVSEKYDLARLLRWKPKGRDRVTNALHAVAGLAHEGTERLRPLPEEETLRHAGILGRRVRTAQGLRAILAAELALPVRIEQFHLRWRRLPKTELTRAGGSARLGRAAAAGARAPDLAGQVRIRVGPVRYPDFLSLGEGRARLDRLRRLARFHLPAAIDFDVQVVLDRRDIPRTQLGGAGPAAQLGWNVWARTAPAQRDVSEAVLGSRPSREAE